ncbi:hypothetical protein QBC46DRAFT_414238 [Diplogelasinospora grovesii]|uniref:Uncharacterized protein n=1 Tax=Diplogelasinospora grovesii TaxID=303347 RepID=A0AAN6RZ25_9PEZI|nr:hypothetical protein QBC46DRAFT_414238 [Diplogelasinospora grovesii]
MITRFASHNAITTANLPVTTTMVYKDLIKNKRSSFIEAVPDEPLLMASFAYDPDAKPILPEGIEIVLSDMPARPPTPTPEPRSQHTITALATTTSIAPQGHPSPISIFPKPDTRYKPKNPSPLFNEVKFPDEQPNPLVIARFSKAAVDVASLYGIQGTADFVRWVCSDDTLELLHMMAEHVPFKSYTCVEFWAVTDWLRDTQNTPRTHYIQNLQDMDENIFPIVLAISSLVVRLGETYDITGSQENQEMVRCLMGSVTDVFLQAHFGNSGMRPVVARSMMHHADRQKDAGSGMGDMYDSGTEMDMSGDSDDDDEMGGVSIDLAKLRVAGQQEWEEAGNDLPCLRAAMGEIEGDLQELRLSVR